MNVKQFGILIGILLGITYALRGVSGTLEVAVFGILGWVVTKVMEGELDPIELLQSRRRS